MAGPGVAGAVIHPPAAAAASSSATAIVAGATHSCRIQSGLAYCWGSNSNGQLGNGSTISSSEPVPVSTVGVLAGKTLTQIDAGTNFTCALDSAGAAYCWGLNGNGQLGNGSVISSSVPVAVTTSGALAGKTLTQLDAGAATACALDSGGLAYCWGAGGSGQLGNGTTTGSQSTAVAVTTTGVLSGKTLTQITAGSATECALDSAGLAYCWGAGGSGQLGNGTTTAAQSTAVAVTTTGVLSGKTLTQITAGAATVCALASTGLAYCWGAGGSGQLGNGTTTGSQSTAVAVTTTGVLAGKTLTQITANNAGSHECALDSAGSAYCWGLNSSGQVGNGATAVNFSVPVAVTSAATRIAGGVSHSCVISNGKAYCWGDNTGGELGNGSTTQSNVPVAVSTSGVLSGKTLIQVSGGSDFTCALDSAGSAYCWGLNANGELGNGSTTGSSVPVAVTTTGALSGKTLTQISVGGLHACALDSAGLAYCWGFNSNGQLGNNTTTDSDVPVAATASGVLSGKTLTQITAGGVHTCAVDSSGLAYCWGDDSAGELGNNSTTDSSVPVAVTTSGVLSGKTLTQLSGGSNFTCALGSTGAAYCWGTNANGELGNGSTTGSSVPVAVTTTGVLSGKTLTGITRGAAYACALDSAGLAYCWGQNANGQLGNNSTTDSDVPVAVTATGVLSGKTLAQVGGGGFDACALDSAGTAYCWGLNTSGQLGNNSTTQSAVPVFVAPQAPLSVAAFPGNAKATVYWSAPAFVNNGTITGYSASASPGGASCSTTTATTCTITGLTNGTTYTIIVTITATTGTASSAGVIVTPGPPTTAIATGLDHSCVISAGKAYCWGDNNHGQLGNNSTTSSNVPQAVTTTGALTGVTLTQITAGQFFTCALGSTGAAYCWGDGANGRLGNNATTDSSVPVAVTTSGVLAGVALTQISAGPNFACALGTAGAAYCWGAGSTGALGNNATADSSVPVAVLTSGVLSGKILVQVTAAQTSACALDSTGTAYCWGSDVNGQLGNNSTTQSLVPVAVTTSGALSGVTLTEISGGGSFACALSAAGAAYCWGLNSNGQLGNNSTTQSLVPVAVTTSGALSGVNVVQLGAGQISTCALSAAGTAYCWGGNTDGQLGNNAVTQSLVPVAVTTTGVLSAKNVTQITGSLSGNQTCAMDSAGTAYCWGLNANGQLGNNAVTQSLVAVLVAPQGPTSVIAAPGDTTAAVSWTAPVFLNNGAITGYAVTASPGSATCSTTTATSCSLTGLTDGTTYTITVTVTATTGTAPSLPVTVTPAGFLTLASPSSLTWAVTASGFNQSAVDTVAGNQQLTATDNTGTGAGWHITVSATTFINGSNSLPGTGAIEVTGSTSSLTSTAPSVTCVGSCTLPTNTTTYPVVINTAASLPPAFTIYDTSAATGLGVMTIGGSSAAHPIGWWVQVPGSVRAGSYVSTVTITVASGP
jgi:alpha-tubulin suppressor-like RCC1 family protein